MTNDQLVLGISAENIQSKIYTVRGLQVMLDKDLAELYNVETRALNQAVRRNIERFPEDFMFSLTREEIRNLSQFVIGSKIKHAPNVFVFTEQEVIDLPDITQNLNKIWFDVLKWMKIN